jgi:hypothetical protein
MNLQEYKKFLQPFRVLDINDIYIMAGLYDKKAQHIIAKELNLCASAVCVRLTRYRDSFGEDFFLKKKGRSILSEKGNHVCKKAKLMFEYLLAEMN